MNGTVAPFGEPLAKPHVQPVLPTELWLTIFDYVVTYDLHIFDQSLRYRRERTRSLQNLQYVCKSWRDMIKPFVYRHIALDGNGDHLGSHGYYSLMVDHVETLAHILDQTTNPGVPKASLVRSFWIQRDGREEGTDSSLTVLQEALPALLSRMTNLSELCCRFDLHGPQVACVARSHGSQLTRLAIECGSPYSTRISSPQVLSLLKRFTALTDLHLGIHGQTGELDSIDAPDLPKLRFFELVADATSDVLMNWLAQWKMPRLSTFACRKSVGCSKHMCEETIGLSAFMTRHGAGLRTLRIDDSCEDLQLVIFPHTPCLDVLDVFGAMHLLSNLPISVTQIAVREFGDNLGYQARELRFLLQTVQLLPPEKKLHTIRVVSDMVSHDKHLHEPAAFVWREKLRQADTRRVVTWREFNNHAKGLLELGVLVLDEQNVALTDVLEEMRPSQESVRTELLESTTDLLPISDK
ncbi:hypothetical protein G6011_10993 [Alternaria panax]|uniref:F-box domain-containing protein n=1 Tax=Alternaria panax TaxID=48097 RepID=A0AAD4ICY8_9PLEO|nr:hypothetical protein G6011_10993 [Alternaria panax]